MQSAKVHDSLIFGPSSSDAATASSRGAIVIERNHLEWRLFPGREACIPEAVDNKVAWIILCDEGFASSLAAATLQQLGLQRTTDVVGGFRAWRAAGLPIWTTRRGHSAAPRGQLAKRLRS